MKCLVFGLVAAASLAAAPLSAHATPCDGVRFDRGEIVLGAPLAPVAELTDAGRACISAVANALIDRPFVRSVTVSVRMPDAQRASGAGLTTAQAIRDMLVEAGVDRRRVSAVAPAAATGEPASVRMSYVERPSPRAVALIVAFGGDVRVTGPAIAPVGAELGQRLIAYTTIETGTRSNARVFLADGSFAWIGADTEVRIGRIDLTAQLKRRVQLDLRRGSVETKAVFGGGDSVFDIATRVGVAGVRGTTFRVVASGAETRLETVSGAVELTGGDGAVAVGGGFGSRVDTSGTPETPRALLAAPRGLRPIRGALAATAALTWQPVDGAVRYVVHAARDAEFSVELTDVATTAATLLAADVASDGAWFWRVTAVDADGFVGMPSRVYRFERTR